MRLHPATQFRQNGLKGLEPESKRRKTNPHQNGPDTPELIKELRISLITQGLDAGATTIAWHLEQQGITPPGTSTIWRILNWLDDHSLYMLSCKAFKPVTGVAVVETFKDCINQYGPPQSTLTDNGSVYTARFVKGRNQFEYLLRTLGIRQKNGSPGHPQTQGKIERFHQTRKRWLGQQMRCKTIEELQTQLHTFSNIYNKLRPHKTNGLKTPKHAYEATIKAQPEGSTLTEHFSIRFDNVDKFGKTSIRRAGRLHHLGPWKSARKNRRNDSNRRVRSQRHTRLNGRSFNHTHNRR